MNRIKVAAVQSGVDPRWSPTEWANHLRWQLAACRDVRSDLAVFPAWTGAFRESFPRGYPQEALGVMLRLLGDLARDAGLYLVPGCIPIRCAAQVKLRAYLLSPGGEVLGWQDQICPPPGYAGGHELAVFSTSLGRIGLIIGSDSSIPEIGRILALQGADLLCAPAAYLKPINPWRQIAGLWRTVQANQIAGVEACLAGEFNGATYQGRSQIVVPVENTPSGDGFLAQADSLDGTEIVAGQIDLDALNEARSSYPVFTGFNLGLYRNSLAEAYHRICGRPGQPGSAPAANASLAAGRAREPEGGN